MLTKWHMEFVTRLFKKHRSIISVGTIKSIKTSWARHVACKGEQEVYKIVGKPRTKRLLAHLYINGKTGM
jgi:hypothetical protein